MGRGVRRLMTTATPESRDRQATLRSYLTGARVAATVSLGVRLGLYKAMEGAGALTSAELAARLSYSERWVREWLHGQVAAGIISYDSGGEFHLPAELAVLLANSDDLGYVGYQFEFLPKWMGIVEQTPEAFRTGICRSRDDLGGWEAERLERVFRNWYRLELVPKALPQLASVVPRLEAGANVADVGCGAGLALIEMAKA